MKDFWTFAVVVIVIFVLLGAIALGMDVIMRYINR